MDTDFPAHPLLGLLLRLAYQHHSQEIEAALRENGFEDVHPAAANVFSFVRPEGITVSELADLARVRKQTMAQAVDQLERTGTSSAARTRATAVRGWCSSPSAARPSPPSPTPRPPGWKSAGRS